MRNPTLRLRLCFYDSWRKFSRCDGRSRREDFRFALGRMTPCTWSDAPRSAVLVLQHARAAPLAPQQGCARGKQELLRERDGLRSIVRHLFSRNPPPPASRYRHSGIHAAGFVRQNVWLFLTQEGQRRIEAGCSVPKTWRPHEARRDFPLDVRDAPQPVTVWFILFPLTPGGAR